MIVKIFERRFYRLIDINAGVESISVECIVNAKQQRWAPCSVEKKSNVERLWYSLRCRVFFCFTAGGCSAQRDLVSKYVYMWYKQRIFTLGAAMP